MLPMDAWRQRGQAPPLVLLHHQNYRDTSHHGSAPLSPNAEELDEETANHKKFRQLKLGHTHDTRHPDGESAKATMGHWLRIWDPLAAIKHSQAASRSSTNADSDKHAQLVFPSTHGPQQLADNSQTLDRHLPCSVVTFIVKSCRNLSYLRQVFVVCLLASAALAIPGGYGGGGHGGGGGGGGGYGGGGYNRPTPYAFDYGVSAGYNNFGHSEKGNGYGGVHGGYWVNLPDGRVQRVSYVADYSGYHPVVTYSGKAHYPASYGYGHGGGGGGGYH
ncbi:hypothetical protein O3P69_003991 [Scylla paramamosain]|uniref:Pro-resilin n=1 Tax=Scylla paramamosain TaxID=85552 RepID=A0AAW0UFC7_SCYPA